MLPDYTGIAQYAKHQLFDGLPLGAIVRFQLCSKTLLVLLDRG